jgi:hypothetical protein
MSGLAGIGTVRQALAAGTIFALASVVGTAAGEASGMMGGSSGGSGFHLNLGTLSIAPLQPTGHCTTPGEVWSSQQRRCVLATPTKQTVTCTFPMVKERSGGCGCAPGYASTNNGCTKFSVVKTPPVIIDKPGIVVTKTPTCRQWEFYSPDTHSCVRRTTDTANCTYPMVHQGTGCGCAPGYFMNGNECTQSPTIVVAPPPVIVTPPPVIVGQPPPPPVIEINVIHIQQCLQKLGYDPGAVDGNLGQGTRTAFRTYQQENGLDSRPFYLGDRPTQLRLFQMCDATQQASLPPGPTAPPPAPPPPPTLTKIAPLRCLSPDLYDMLKTTYGKAPAIQPCSPQTAACVPKPLAFDDAKLQSVAASSGITWCNNACIRLGSYLPLSTIEAIETAAHVTLCASPPALCYLPGRPVVEKQVEIRTIYKDMPVGAGNEGNIAVVVGNETYQNDVTPHVYGHADADAMVQLLTEQLGYRKDHIIDLRDATLADLQRVFGTADNPAGELATRIKAGGGSTPPNVIVYVSSHGIAKEDGSVAYLLPADGKTDDLDHSGYPLQLLYANLGKAGAGTIMLMLEATFGTAITDAIDAPNIPQLEVAAMPETPVAGLAVFTASDRDQHALEDPEYGIGLFTRYMIAGLAGDADKAPIGKGDKRIDTVELYVYTADKVRTAARKSFGVEQKPILSKIENLIVGTLASN